jgi:hypothetical protein
VTFDGVIDPWHRRRCSHLLVLSLGTTLFEVADRPLRFDVLRPNRPPRTSSLMTPATGSHWKVARTENHPYRRTIPLQDLDLLTFSNSACEPSVHGKNMNDLAFAARSRGSWFTERRGD